MFWGLVTAVTGPPYSASGAAPANVRGGIITPTVKSSMSTARIIKIVVYERDSEIFAIRLRMFAAMSVHASALSSAPGKHTELRGQFAG